MLGLAACNQESLPLKSDKTDKTAQESASVNTKKSTNGQSANYQKQGENKIVSKNQVHVTLSKTVDGDTIKVIYNGNEETVRYLLIDTPEEKKPGVCVQPYAIDAAKRNNQLLNSGRITLEFEKGKNKTDKYGRLLAYVFVNGASVQEALLKEGYARVAYVYEPPYKYLNQYINDEKTAISKHLHIWSKPGYVTNNGFKGCADSSSSGSANSLSSTSSFAPGSGGSEFFANCTELRKVYPDGVPKGHPAYRAALDRDKDGFACEK